MVFIKVYVLYYPSSTRWLLIWSYFSSPRYFTNRCFIYLKFILLLLTCVIHFTAIIIHVLRGSLSSGLCPVSFAFRKEVLFFSCPETDLWCWHYAEACILLSWFSRWLTLPYARWSWSFFLREADPLVILIGLSYILFLSRCSPSRYVPFFRSVLSSSSFPSDLTSCLHLIVRVSHSRCLPLVSLSLYRTP